MPHSQTQFIKLTFYSLPVGIAASLALLITISLAVWIKSVLDATGFTFCRAQFFSAIVDHAPTTNTESQKILRGRPAKIPQKLWLRRINTKSKTRNTVYTFRRTLSTISAIDQSISFDIRQTLRKNIKRERCNRHILLRNISSQPEMSEDNFYVLTKRSAPGRFHWLRNHAGPRPIREGLSHLFDYAGRSTTLFLILGFFWSLLADRQFSQGPIMLPLLGAFIGIFYWLTFSLIIRNKIFSLADKWGVPITILLLLIVFIFLISWIDLFRLYLKVL